MAEKRKGRKSPTQSVVLPYKKSKGKEVIRIYNKSKRRAQEWQKMLLEDIMAINDEKLWTHAKFGYTVPRRNGKSEILIMRAMWGASNGERVLYTAHRTTTSHGTWEKICARLDEIKADYKSTKQMGLERIEFASGGLINFRTRSSKGGLGEGYDCLLIDEAQEYTDDQETALKYVVTDSKNPQTIFCGTPPTMVSVGTVFTKMRTTVLEGKGVDSGWAEWAVDGMSDVNDIDLWYKCNPSLGTIFTERAVRAEIGEDDIDFNIQRLGLWLKYNQKSVISKVEWDALQATTKPEIKGKLYAGIKYNKDGSNVSMSIAVRTWDDDILLECIDCRPIRSGNDWILQFLLSADIEKVIVDGAGSQEVLKSAMKDVGLKSPTLPTVKEVMAAYASFEQALEDKAFTHMGQLSLAQAASSCDKRLIGSSGGWGYKSLREDVDISILDSAVLAYYLCSTSKEKKKRRKASY